MDKFMHYFAIAKALYFWFCSAAAPWLVAVAIPSTVAALSNVPKASGVVAFLLKVCRFLGVLTHANEPGTMKAPLGIGAIFQGLKDALRVNGPTLALIIAALGGLGCASFRAWEAAHPKTAKALDCGTAAVESAVADVLPDVISALTGGAPDWGALTHLEEQHGMDVIGCAVQAVLGAASEAQKPENGLSEAGRGMAARAGINAMAYLKARGMQ